MTPIHHNNKSPNLPAFLSTACKLIPSKIHSNILVVLLNHLLAEQIRDGELDFLKDNCLCVNITDANIKYYVSLNKDNSNKNKLFSVLPGNTNDIEIKASVFDFMQLAARQQDPDTLVFQRRLIMQGNTELGLELKNFIDGLDLESSNSFSTIDIILKKSLPVYSRLFS